MYSSNTPTSGPTWEKKSKYSKTVTFNSLFFVIGWLVNIETVLSTEGLVAFTARIDEMSREMHFHMFPQIALVFIVLATGGTRKQPSLLILTDILVEEVTSVAVRYWNKFYYPPITIPSSVCGNLTYELLNCSSHWTPFHTVGMYTQIDQGNVWIQCVSSNCSCTCPPCHIYHIPPWKFVDSSWYNPQGQRGLRLE